MSEKKNTHSKDNTHKHNASSTQSVDPTKFELETLWSISPDLLCVADFNTATFIKVNPSFTKVLGYDEGDLLDKPFLDFIHPDDIEPTIKVIEENLKQGITVINFINRYRCKDGSYKYLDWISRPIKERGQTFAIARDVSDRVGVEEKLHEQSREMQSVLKSMLNAFVIFDSVFDKKGKFISYRFVYINDAYEKITGVKNDEVRGKTVHEVWPETEQSWIEKYGYVATTGETLVFDNYHEPTKKLYHCRVYRPWDSQDRFCVIFDDITDWRKAERELELLSQFPKQNPYPVMRIKMDGTILFKNDASDMILKKWGAKGGNKVTDQALRFVRKALTSQTQIQHEIEFGKRFFTLTFSPIPGSDLVNVYGLDITVRHDAEVKLKESEEKFHSIFDNVPEGLIYTDLKGSVIEVNDELCKIVDINKEELLDKKAITLAKKFLDKKMIEPVLKTIGKALIGKKIAPFEIEFYDKYLQISANVHKKSKRIIGVIRDITTRKQTQEAIKEKTNFLNTITDTSPVGIVQVNADGLLTFANPEAEKILHLEKSEITSRTYDDPEWQIVDFDGNPLPNEKLPFSIVKNTGEHVKEIHHAIKLQNGEMVYLSINAAPLFTETNTFSGMVASIEDITARVIAEKEIKQKGELLRATGKMAKVGGWELDAKTKKVYWSEETYRIHEVPLDQEPPLADAINFFHPDDRPILQKAITNALEKGKPYDLTLRFITAKGKNLITHTMCEPILEGGKVIKLFGTFQDITPIKKVEEELREALNFNKTLLDTSPDIIYIYDILEYINIYTNQGLNKILGYSIKEIQEMGNKLIATLMHPDDLQVYLNETYPKYKDLLDGELLYHEYRMKHKDGSWRWLNCRESIYLRLEDGTPKQIFGLVNDITDSKTIQDKLEESHARLLAILNGIKEPIYIADMDTYDVIFVNQVVEDIFGDPAHKKCYKYLQNRDEPCPFCTNDKIQGDYKDESYIWEFQNEINGRWYRCIDRALKWPDGRTVRYEMAIDIDEQKRAEEIIESNYRMLHLAGETARFGGWTVDLKTNTCVWSDAVADIHEVPHGYSPPVEEGIHFYAPEWRDRITKVFNDCAERGIPYDEEMEILTQKGKRLWVRTIGRAIKNEEGEIVGIHGAFQDISGKKKSEEEIKISEERFRELFNTMGSYVAVYEPYNDGEDFIFKDVNKAAEIQSNIKKSEVVGKKVTEVFPFVKEMGLFEIFQKTYKTGKKLHHPLVLYKDERMQQWVENDVYKLPSGEIVAVYEDTSQLKKAEESLRKHQEQLEELVRERTAELENSNAELKRMNKLFLGREFRIKELRDKVKELENELDEK
ncbi:MAG: PAS domain S-box protein [Candidatus Cloacimonetes bacterium]|nr:PAS domain S-box protein [Candidatus Cloacimonadota bacterium]